MRYMAVLLDGFLIAAALAMRHVTNAASSAFFTNATTVWRTDEEVTPT